MAYISNIWRITTRLTRNVYVTYKNRSAKKISNDSGFNIELCVTPNTISIQVL